MNADDLFGKRPRELRDAFRDGYAITPDDIAGYAYRGVSLGLPDIAVRLTWLTFQKIFVKDEERGMVRGFNVRLEQNGRHAASVPRTRGAGEPWTFGHFAVVSAKGRTKAEWERGVLLDYGAFTASRLPSPQDPVVSLRPDSADLLLGFTYLAVGRARLATPSWFTLEREGPATIDASPTRT